jgi:two-component system chemotaxis response regulator CheY
MIHMPELSEIKVLVVDDDLQIRNIIKSLLTALGVKEVTIAVNGQEAYDILKVPPSSTQGGGRRKFDLVVCDWMMPVMTGIDLLHKVRADSFLKETPFLMVTAENEHDNIVKAIGEGVTDYVVKPFTATILEQKLRKIVAKIKK